MSIEKVREYFKKYNLEDKIKEFDVSSATVELAALALGCEKGRIAKTLSFKVDDKPILIVTSGDVKVDNSKYKQYFKAKAKMLSFEEVEPLIGHKVGGVCPFAVNKGVRIYLDNSLKKYQTTYPACGSSNSAIEFTCDDYERYCPYESWVEVTKPIE